MITTTLNAIRAQHPCEDGWKRLLIDLGKTKADDEPLPLVTILNSNGIDDALWCLRAVEGFDKEKRLFAVWCARQVQHLMKDDRGVAAVDVAERFANGLASQEELEAAWAAADAAARAVHLPCAADAAACQAADAAYCAIRAARAAAYAAWQSASAAYSAAYAAYSAADAAADAVVDVARTAQTEKFKEIFG